jgi:hypothetical protein
MNGGFFNSSLKRQPIAWVLIPLLAAGAAVAQRPSATPGLQPLHKDIYVVEKDDRLVFGNDKLTLELGKQNGEWLSLAARGIPGALARRTEIPASVDFRIDDVWMVEEHGAAPRRRG